MIVTWLCFRHVQALQDSPPSNLCLRPSASGGCSLGGGLTAGLSQELLFRGSTHGQPILRVKNLVTMLPFFIRPVARNGCCMLTSSLVTPFTWVVSTYCCSFGRCGKLKIGFILALKCKILNNSPQCLLQGCDCVQPRVG